MRETMTPAGWVIDGNYEAKLGETVLAEADTIVWLDLPLWLKLRRIWKRTRHRIRNDVELWNGNRETLAQRALGLGLALLVDGARPFPPQA